MSFHSIRFRLTLWYALALTAGLVLFGFATWLSMRHSLLRDLDRSLSQRTLSAQAFVLAELNDPNVHLAEELDEYAHGLPSGSYLKIWNDKGAVVFTSNTHFPWPRNSNQRRLEWDGHPYLLLSEPKIILGRPWQFAISASLQAADSLLNQLRLSLFTLLPLVIAAASLGGSWLSRRALAPVDELTLAARSLSLDNLSARLAVPPTSDELARLTITWNSMLSRLEQTMGRLSRFTADASHELRTPLAVIRTTAELALRRDRSPESYRQALTRIVSESERMTTLLDDLLLLARVDSESVELPKSTLDVTALIAQVCSQLQPLADAKELLLNFPSSSEVVYVAANEPAMRRLLLVLLDNAVKYSRPGGAIGISVHATAGSVNLEISDSGPGIEPADLDHIFERFFRSPQARQTNPEGSGLGLSLAAAIAQRHKARIAVTQSSQLGTTFSICFPAECPDETRLTPTSANHDHA